MHAVAGRVRHGLGHEGGVHPVLHGDFLHHLLVGHDSIGHGERIGVAQVDLVLGGTLLMVGVLHGNAHLLQGEHRVAAQVGGGIERRQIEIAAVVEHLGALGVLEVEVLQLGPHDERVAGLGGPTHYALQHMARISRVGFPFRRADVADHAGHGVGLGAPGQDLEGGGVGKGQHIRLLRRREPLDAAGVEAHALLEGALQLAGHHREGLHVAQNVGEPEPNEMHIPALHRFQDEVLLRIRNHLYSHRSRYIQPSAL